MTRTTKPQRGFALLEVMIAGVVTIVGLLAVFALQFSALESNARALEFTNATNIATSHIEVLKKEALQWNDNTLPDADFDPVIMPNLERGRPTPAAALATGGWVVAPYHDGGDLLNISMELDQPDVAGHVYCVHQRLTFLNTADGTGTFFPEVLRVEVRVLWPRTFRGSFAGNYPDCGVADPGGMAADIADVVSLTIPTTIKRHPSL